MLPKYLGRRDMCNAEMSQVMMMDVDFFFFFIFPSASPMELGSCPINSSDTRNAT